MYVFCWKRQCVGQMTVLYRWNALVFWLWLPSMFNTFFMSTITINWTFRYASFTQLHILHILQMHDNWKPLPITFYILITSFISFVPQVTTIEPRVNICIVDCSKSLRKCDAYMNHLKQHITIQITMSTHFPCDRIDEEFPPQSRTFAALRRNSILHESHLYARTKSFASNNLRRRRAVTGSQSVTAQFWNRLCLPYHVCTLLSTKVSVLVIDGEGSWVLLRYFW